MPMLLEEGAENQTDEWGNPRNTAAKASNRSNTLRLPQKVLWNPLFYQGNKPKIGHKFFDNAYCMEFSFYDSYCYNI
ncbi:MAG TPA: hypothetical protein DEO65_11790 [Bacillus bacterium]|nr:hypothetical protein [Bacillus sp. (in: firmicutes)]